MDDDFNTAGALAAIFGLMNAANKYLAEGGQSLTTAATLRAADTIQELLGVLGIDISEAAAEDELPSGLTLLARELTGFAGDDVDAAAKALLCARQEARANRDWSRADAIRDGISTLGLVVEDTAAGVRLRRNRKA